MLLELIYCQTIVLKQSAISISSLGANSTTLFLQFFFFFFFFHILEAAGNLISPDNSSLREKCPNTELFLVRFFLYLD